MPQRAVIKMRGKKLRTVDNTPAAALAIAAMLAAVTCAGPAAATPKKPARDVDAVLRQLGASTIRGIDSDICLPATAAEYEALGKNAVVMVTASSAIATELPVRSVYALHKGVRIPLRRIALLPPSVDAEGRVTQISFHILPIQLMKRDTQLLADFTGERKAFGFHSFTAAKGLDAGAPAFARLDEYDDPSEPDDAALRDLLKREYPSQFE